MSTQTMTLFKREDLDTMTRKSKSLFKRLKLDNITHRKHTVKTWDKYRVY